MANEYPVEAVTQIKSPIDWAKQNPVGAQPTEQGGHPLIQSTRENMIAGTDQYARALEERFAQPNWLKVSAAFAKPQLGGFGASFGSAMDELGKQEEARRSVAPSVARMKAEVAAGQYGQSQRIVQQEKYDELMRKGFTVNGARDIIKYDPTSPIAQALEKEIGLRSTAAGTASTLQGTSAREQELMKADPFYIPMDKDLQQDWKTFAAGRQESFKNGLMQSGLFSPEQIAQMTPAQLQENYAAVSKQESEKRLTDTSKSDDVVATSMNTLSQLSMARELAKSKDMEKLLGIGSGQEAVSALFGFLASNQNDPNGYSRLSEAARKLAQDDPNLYAKFIVLQKALNTNVAQARSEMENKTNLATGLLQSTYPNVAMPQKSIVNLLDLMAAQTMRDARVAAAIQSPEYRNQDPRRFKGSDAYVRINDDMTKTKEEILGDKYFKESKPRNLYYSGSIFEGIPRPQSRQNAGAGAAPQRRIRSARDLIDEANAE